MSTWDMIQPPKTSPWMLASAGIGMTRNTASRLAGKVVKGVLVLEVMRPAPMQGNQPIMQEKRGAGAGRRPVEALYRSRRVSGRKLDDAVASDQQPGVHDQ
ncbi:MAG: hypothetical protein NTT76_06655, partial [Achromobacter xylosoxidans]|nr:hypothetical protein [Achromobacter xylosoxidans]